MSDLMLDVYIMQGYFIFCLASECLSRVAHTFVRHLQRRNQRLRAVVARVLAISSDGRNRWSAQATAAAAATAVVVDTFSSELNPSSLTASVGWNPCRSEHVHLLRRSAARAATERQLGVG